MVDRLEKMRSRATGNGVTQCLLCQTDFGLLASKSYAAMCNDCRKVSLIHSLMKRNTRLILVCMPEELWC